MPNNKQEKCIKLMVSEGLTQKEIAKLIKVSEQTICTWKKDDEFIAAYKAEVKSEMQFVVTKALRALVKLLDSSNEWVRRMAANDILEMLGYKAAENSQIENMSPVQIINNIPRTDRCD